MPRHGSRITLEDPAVDKPRNKYNPRSTPGSAMEAPSRKAPIATLSCSLCTCPIFRQRSCAPPRGPALRPRSRGRGLLGRPAILRPRHEPASQPPAARGVAPSRIAATIRSSSARGTVTPGRRPGRRARLSGTSGKFDETDTSGMGTYSPFPQLLPDPTAKLARVGLLVRIPLLGTNPALDYSVFADD